MPQIYPIRAKHIKYFCERNAAGAMFGIVIALPNTSETVYHTNEAACVVACRMSHATCQVTLTIIFLYTA
jgi:hypothetical protein